jgi:hypothetical protein
LRAAERIDKPVLTEFAAKDTNQKAGQVTV